MITGRPGRDVFVDRRHELSRLREVSTKVTRGEPWLVVVEAESGVGKTALIRHFVAELDAFTVLYTVADRNESDLPGAVLGQLMGGVDPAVRDQFPLLAGDCQNATRFAIGGQLIALLDRLQERRPVTVVVDDAQWIDELSLRTLLFALRRLWADQVLVILGVRRGTTPLHGELLALVRSHPRTLHIVPPLFGTAEITELVARTLHLDLPKSVVSNLRERTGGNVLYLRTLLAEVPAERLRQGDEPPMSPSLVAAIQDQLSFLPAESRALVEAMAVLGARVPLRLAAQVAGLADVDTTARALQAALHAEMVQCWPHDPVVPVALRHRMQQDATYVLVPAGRRRRLHAAAAQVVDAAAAWQHRVAAAAGGPDPVLAGQLEAVAGEERRGGRHALAATHLLWAADLSDIREDRERRLLTAVLELAAANQFARLATLRTPIEACTPGFLRELAAILVNAAVGDGAAAKRHADSAWEAARGAPDATQWATYAGFILPGGFIVAGAAAETVATARWVLATGDLDDERTSSTRAVLAWGVLLADGPRAALRTIAELPADASADTPSNADLIAARGVLQVLDGHLSAGLADLQVAMRRADNGAQIVAARRAWAFAAWAYFLRGEWDEAALIADIERSRLAWSDYPFDHMAGMWVPAARGDRNAANRQLAMVREAAGPPGGDGGNLCVAVARAILAEATGDYRTMHDALGFLAGEAPPQPRDRIDHAYTARWWRPLLAEAQIGTGRFEAAGQTLAGIGDVEEVPYLRLHVARLRGWLCARQGEFTAALRVYREAASSPVTPDDSPWYRGRLQLSYGRLLRRIGQPRAAAERLRDAHAVFATLGAAPTLELCANELRLCGVRAPDRHVSYLGALTEREREVARQIGMGRTNREISVELFVSSKTVEYHLGNIYSKLGISSRRNLRDLVQQDARSSDPAQVRGLALRRSGR
jgi:DNA-binding CsgD family transcriptional regulator